MKLVFSDKAWAYLFWREADPDVLRHINALLKEAQKSPYTGSGKPEPLMVNLKGWSRRITREHRLVYRVTGAGDTQAPRSRPAASTMHPEPLTVTG